ncbi:MAG: hypothetical protein DRJ42_21995 [Deltaproteobacteria bacterium]|nr:MAG: hypothetical protein DRJ42_21995 [Deltaproteobacteria bacterium]
MGSPASDGVVEVAEVDVAPQLCEYLRREIPSDDTDLDSCELLPGGVDLPGGRRADIVEMFESQGPRWRSATLVIREEGASAALYFYPVFTGGAVREELEGWYTLGELVAEGDAVELIFDTIQPTDRTSPNEQRVEHAPQAQRLRCGPSGEGYSCEAVEVSP